MKHLNKIIALIVTLVAFSGVQAQNESNPWAFSFGANAVSTRPSAGPTGEGLDRFSNYFDANNQWSILPAVSYVGVSRHISGGFSVGITGSINKINKWALYNPMTQKHYVVNPEFTFYAVDLNGKYGFQELLSSKYFDPYVYLGTGWTKIGGDNALSLNGGLGLNTWITEGLAITLQTGYRGQAGADNNARNHFQHLLGLTFAIGAKDTDKDGVNDKKDECPEVAGLVQFNGCPDTDGDGIQDKEDACPDVAGLVEFKGCPDTDGDGIEDKEDACPNVKGLAQLKGCPDADNDGVADKDDKCPQQAGPKENAGCPWPDTDGDGVLDKDDICPKTKGTIENKGCPVVTKEVVKQLNDFLAKSVTFDTGKTTITKESFETLDGIVAIMAEYGNDRFEIQGHTDTVGKKAANQLLSEGRANAIKQYLLAKGISAGRLTSIGYGQEKPVASNKNAKGRALNRRVEIVHITQ